MFILSVVFWIIDARSQALLKLAVPGLIEHEKRFHEHSASLRLIACVARSWFVTPSRFRILFILQLVFGAGVMLFGAFSMDVLIHAL